MKVFLLYPEKVPLKSHEEKLNHFGRCLVHLGSTGSSQAVSTGRLSAALGRPVGPEAHEPDRAQGAHPL